MSVSHCFLLGVVLCLLVLVHGIDAQVSDPCNLPPNNGTTWFGPPSRVKSCFNNIPFNETTRASTMKIMERIFALYSFSDIVTAGVAPFNLRVDWPSMLGFISNHNDYKSDFEFHNALASFMASLLDAHAIYYAPTGYRLFATLRPFAIVSRLVNGTQQFFAAPSRLSANTYAALCNCEEGLELFYGRRILYIDNVPVMDYLKVFAANTGFYLDPGAQLNNLVSASSAFAFQSTAFMPFPTSDTMTMVFEGDLVPYTFNLYMTTTRTVTSTQQIINMNMPLTNKRDATESDEFLDPLVQDEEAVLQLLNRQQARASLTSMQKKQLNDHMTRLQTSIRIAREVDPSHGELRRMKSLAPSVRFQQVMDAWGHYLATETGAPDLDWSMFPANDPLNAASDVSSTSTMAALLTGVPEKLVSYVETSALSYWSYDDTSVLKLKSFHPPTEKEVTEFINLVNTASHSRSTNGLNKNLIIDVSKNGGGYVCLSYFMLSYLARPWNKGSLTGGDILFNPYDIRQSKYTDDLFDRGYWGSGMAEVSETTREPLGKAFYTDRVTRSYGPQATSNYTQKFLWNLCDADTYETSLKKSMVFDKILVITDGRCGSACSYFLSKLMTSGKVHVMSYGGKWGELMDTSAFSGGNVHNWDDWVRSLRLQMPSLSWTQNLPTTAVTTFNFREMYNPGDDVPRQFIRMPADFVLPYWDPLFVSASSLDNPYEREILANLYASAMPLFEKIPPGRLGQNTPKALIVALTIIVCLIVASIVATVIACIVSSTKNRITPDYGDLSSVET